MNEDIIDLPASCFVYVAAEPGHRIGLVTHNMPGVLYPGIDRHELTDAEARRLVNTLNSARGVNPETSERMLALATIERHPASNSSYQRVAA